MHTQLAGNLDLELLTGLTDGEISTSLSILRSRPDLFRMPELMIRDMLKLRELRTMHYPSKPEIFSEVHGRYHYWLYESEILFLRGHYGPCCAWARATIEYHLRKKCESDLAALVKTEEWVKSHGGRSPGVWEYLDALGLGKGDTNFDLCMGISGRAAEVLHHKLDKLVSDNGIEEKYGHLSSQALEIIRSADKDVLRYDFEKDKASQSLSALYDLWESRFLP